MDNTIIGLYRTFLPYPTIPTTTTQEQIITSYMDKQKRPTTTQEKQERGK